MRKLELNTGWQQYLIRFSLILAVVLYGQAATHAQCTLGCNDLVQFSLDEDCYSEVEPDHILENPGSCPGNKVVTVMGANGQPIPGSPWVGADYLGQTLTVKVTHPASGNHCWGSIKVEDKLAPELECEDISVACSETAYGPDDLGYPYAYDNCSNDVELTWADVVTDYGCNNLQLTAKIDRQWTASDPSGNTKTCIQHIYFERATLLDVTFPKNRDDVEAPALDCASANTHPNNTGWPMVDGKPIANYCDLVVTYTEQSSSMCMGNLTILRTWTVLDMCSGLTSTDLQIIKVLDKTGPVITCPQDPEHDVKILSYLSGPQYNGCYAEIMLPQVQVSDKCSNYSKLKFQVTTTVNGFLYSINTNGGKMTVPLGTHTFTYKVTDDCGNIGTCSFVRAIDDETPPVVACETIHTVALSDDVTYVNAETFDDGSYDDCSGVTFLVSRMDNPKCQGDDATGFSESAPFYCCDINNGPVMVTLRVTDAAGNTNQCMTQVNVADKVMPSIWCPRDISVACSMPYEPIDAATYSKGATPGTAISATFALTYQVPIDITGLPTDAEIIDLDVFLDIEHEYLDQLKIRLISPNGTNVSLFEGGACGIAKANMLVTFNDEGDDFSCNGPTPSIQGNIKPQAGLLALFDGQNPNSIGNQKWVLEVEDTAPLAGGKINAVTLLFTYGTPLALKPHASDNTEECGLTITWKDKDTPDACPGGFIYRTWTATDAFGLSKSCDQKITFVDLTPWDVEFPMDVTVEDCIDPDDLKNLGNVQHNGDCEMVSVDYVDHIYTVVPDVCYKIERTWYVVNWCKYDKFNPNNTKLGIALPHPKNLKYRDNGDGYFEWVQTIKVIDNLAPKIFCPADLTVDNFEEDCGPTYVDLDSVVYLDCSPIITGTISIDLYNDGSVNIIKTGLEADGEYPNGTHRISYKVEDGCNNFATCSFLLTVVDAKKPNASCHDIQIDLMAVQGGGMAQITPQMLDVASNDNCTPDHKLIFGVTPSVFDCDDLGLNDVTLSVTDAAGNTDICVAVVTVQDNMNVCPTNANGTVSGKVLDANNEGVQYANIQIANMNGMEDETDAYGSFSISGLIPGEAYVVQPIKNTNALNGVSTYDILMIQKHLVGVSSLKSPYKLIAADVNKSGHVSISDVIELRKTLLTASPTFSKNDSWRFVKADYTFLNPLDPFKESWPEFVDTKDMPANGLEVDFIGIKIGDVSGDALPNTLLGSETRNLAGTVEFVTEDAALVPGTVYAMPVRARDIASLEGFQFTLAFDPTILQYAGFQQGDLDQMGNDHIGTNFADAGYLTLSWDGKPGSAGDEDILFTLNFRVSQAAQLHDVMKLTSTYLVAEAYDNDDNLLDATLRFAGENGVIADQADYALYQNRPNPFRSETIIGFDLAAAGHATLTLTDVSGKALRVYEGDFARGYNEFKVNKADLGATGIVYYRLTADGYSATRKMIILE
ncbi:MAG: cohesin domain-containing protein [Saprospiraceae bacterium]